MPMGVEDCIALGTPSILAGFRHTKPHTHFRKEEGRLHLGAPAWDTSEKRSGTRSCFRKESGFLNGRGAGKLRCPACLIHQVAELLLRMGQGRGGRQLLVWGEGGIQVGQSGSNVPGVVHPVAAVQVAAEVNTSAHRGQVGTSGMLAGGAKSEASMAQATGGLLPLTRFKVQTAESAETSLHELVKFPEGLAVSCRRAAPHGVHQAGKAR